MLSLFLNLYEPKENAVDKVSVALDQMNIKGERMLCVSEVRLLISRNALIYIESSYCLLEGLK